MFIDTPAKAIEVLITVLRPWINRNKLTLEAHETHDWSILVHGGPWTPSWKEANDLAQQLNEMGLSGFYSTPVAPTVEERDQIVFCFNASSHPAIVSAMQGVQDDRDRTPVG